MFGRRFLLFRLFDFSIKADASWFILVFIITFSLMWGTFPALYPNLSGTAYVVMGLLGAAGLFASIILHELCHSIVGRYFKMPIDEITLFLFGGVAHMHDEPPSPKSEFFMAVAGPAASVVLAVLFGFLYAIGNEANWSPYVLGLSLYLSQINLILAAFNMIPAFPLDGGRVLRSILWGVKKDLRWATRISAAGGRGFGYFMIAVGLVNFVVFQNLGGLWMFFLGFLLVGVAKASYQNLIYKQNLQGKPVGRFVDPRTITVSPHMNLEDIVRRFLYGTDSAFIPVVENSKLIGCANPQLITRIPEHDWGLHSVREIMEPCRPEQVIDASVDATEALNLMNRIGQSQLLVVDGDQFVGILSMKALLRYMSLQTHPELSPEARSKVSA